MFVYVRERCRSPLQKTHSARDGIGCKTKH
jgi:hypothetical protein